MKLAGLFAVVGVEDGFTRLAAATTAVWAQPCTVVAMEMMWQVKVEHDPETGDSFVQIPQQLWDTDLLTNNARFDMVASSDGSILLRACDMDEDAFRRCDYTNPHPGDPAWTPESVCGLTKWVCAGCGVGSIVEHEDKFPSGWLELIAPDADGNTAGYAPFCSLACVAQQSARLADSGEELPPWALPGF